MFYDQRFYDTIRNGTRLSAEAVVPLLIAELGLEPGSVMIDVGCGEGWWADTFHQHGIEGHGIDGDYIPESPLGDRFAQADLAVGLGGAYGRFDLALSLEVAEHLPVSRAASFVRDLCGLAPTVVFSAAIPGQGGTGHINEQWPEYWRSLFATNGYSMSGAFRFKIWTDPRVENWYCQNLMIATSTPEAYPELFDHPLADPIPVVHPVLYDARRR